MPPYAAPPSRQHSDGTNVAEPFIANVGEPDAGHWLKLSARADGSFSMTNGRTGETRTYPAGN